VFTKTARYYDLVYSSKDYAQEVLTIRALIDAEHPGARTVLDVACGTGEHARLLAEHFAVDGLDLENAFVQLAQQKVPGGRFVVGDMRRFQMGRKYDVILCLFSSIGYLTSATDVVAALTCFSEHLSDGGLILVEPWFTPENWHAGHVAMSPPVDRPEIKLCRMSVAGRQGDLSLIRFHYLIARPEGVDYLQEEHALRLYSIDDMLGFFERAGLSTRYEPEGFVGRGLYVARAAVPHANTSIPSANIR
jgi:trans-aconitate methyltransferase